MKLKDSFITYETDGEQIMVAVGNGADVFRGLVRSNKTAGMIVDSLKSDTTPDKITDKLVAEFDAPREVIAEDVDKIIDKLRSIGAIDE